MSTKFFTNQDENTLFNKLNGVFEHNQTIKHFDVLVGYFRSSGYFKLRPLLENIDKIRILVGIDVDKITAQMQFQGLSLFKGDEQKSIENWQEKYITDIQKASYDEQTEKGIKQFVADIVSNKVVLKAHPSKKIHYLWRLLNLLKFLTLLLRRLIENGVLKNWRP